MTSNESLQLPRKYCILCVDDDLIGLELRAALLEEEGYSVTAVSCPLMALEHASPSSTWRYWILPCLFSTDSSSCYVYALHAHLFRSCCSAV